MKKQKGITLIALVVTIVVLIILATVSINAVVGENGLIRKAQEAKELYDNSIIAEEEAMNTLMEQYDNAIKEPPTYEYENPLPTEPNVTAGMTKVKYNSTSNKWEKVTDDSTEWYNYASNKKEWANVVLPAEGIADALFNSDGTLDESKKYVQLVWIPRYAYKITSQYHTSGSTAGNISVVFIDTNNKDKNGTEYTRDTKEKYPSATTGRAMGDYIVHPAFDYGGNHLTGFWIGKFESSHTGCTTDVSTGKATYTGNEVMTVKPNVTSWRNLTINQIFNTCLSMNKSGNPYGLNSSDTVVDPHLIKNDEWGAVAYLSKSSYGKETEEVYINNNSNFITGIAGDTASASSSTSTTNSYKTTAGVKASTTGTVYGVYDMSGGAWEYVAAYVANNSNVLTTYGADLVASGTASKYRNIYTTSSSDNGSAYSDTTDANNRRAANYALSTPANGHYGDAIYETCAETIDTSTYKSSWYSDYSIFPFSICPFFLRSGACSHETGAGVFHFNNHTGQAYASASFRVVVPIL